MSITEGNGRAVTDRAQNAYGFVSRPVQYASLFYTTYWLSEIKGVDDAGFDFAQLRDLSHRSFQDYGIYSVVSEVSHLYQAFRVDDELLMDVKEEDIDEFLGGFDDLMERMGHQFADEESALVRDLFRSSEGVRRIVAQERNRATFVKTANVAEARWEAFSRPRRFLNTCRKLFDVGYNKALDTGWSVNYGGPSWSGICEHLLRAVSQPKTSWVDTSWGIQHNNSNWLDKTEPAADEVRHLERLVDFPKIQTPRVWVYRTMLTAVLDWNQAGDWDNLYPVAATYDQHVGVNLRRLARPLGVDLPAGEAGIIHTSITGAIEGVGESAPAVEADYVLGRVPEANTEGQPFAIESEGLRKMPPRETFKYDIMEHVVEEGNVIAINDNQNDPGGAVEGLPKIVVAVDVVRPESPGYVTEDTTIELKRGADVTLEEQVEASLNG